MKRFAISLVLLLVVCLNGIGLAQNPKNLVGEWKGIAVINGADDSLTVVITLKEGQLTGVMSDQFQMMEQAPLQELSFSEGILTCFVMVNSDGGELKIQLEADWSEDGTLEGEWFDAVNGNGDQWLIKKVPLKTKN